MLSILQPHTHTLTRTPFFFPFPILSIIQIHSILFLPTSIGVSNNNNNINFLIELIVV